MSNTRPENAEKVMIFRWQPAAVLRVTGEDSFTFLQGQFTNDLRELKKGSAVYGLWLNHKGRVLADSFVSRIGEAEFMIVSYFSPAATIRERLEAFVIADDVTIEDLTPEWRGITLLGARFDELVRDVGSGAVRFVGRRTLRLHEELVFPAAFESDFAALLQGLPEIHEQELVRVRIADAIPAVPLDLGPGELPNEGGLEATAISYVKGCYLGQEVMARLKSLGQVRRRLFRIRGRTKELPSTRDVFQADRRIGELRTLTMTDEGFEALALLSLIHFRPDAGLSFSPGSEPVMDVVDAK